MIDLSRFPASCPLEWEEYGDESEFAKMIPRPVEPWVGLMVWSDYNRLDAYRSSDIRIAAERSLAHMEAQRDLVTEDESTALQIKGSALHARLLDADEWSLYAQAPAWLTNKSRKKDKEEWARLVKEHGEPYVLKHHEYADVVGQAERILSKPLLRTALKDGRSELTFVWPDKDTGLWCKARLDWLTTIGPRVTILDLKGTGDARRHAFQYKIRDYRYDLQGAHYDAAVAFFGIKSDDYTLLASEWVKPYECKLFRMRERTMVLAETQRAQIMERIAEAEQTGIWPGYPDEPETIGLPYGMEKALEEDLRIAQEIG